MIIDRIQNYKKSLFPKTNSRRYQNNSHQRNGYSVAVVEHLEQRLLLTAVESEDPSDHDHHFNYLKNAINKWSSHLKEVVPHSYLEKISSEFSEAVSKYQDKIEKLPKPIPKIIQHVQDHVVPYLTPDDHHENNGNSEYSESPSHTKPMAYHLSNPIKEVIKEAKDKVSEHIDEALSQVSSHKKSPPTYNQYYEMESNKNSHYSEKTNSSNNHSSPLNYHLEYSKPNIAAIIHDKVSQYSNKIEEAIHKIKEVKNDHLHKSHQDDSDEMYSMEEKPTMNYYQPDTKNLKDSFKEPISYITEHHSKEIDQFFKYFPQLNEKLSHRNNSDWINEAEEQGSHIWDKKAYESTPSHSNSYSSYNNDDFYGQNLKKNATGLYAKIKSYF